MKLKNKYVNIVNNVANIYFYGLIVDENFDWWTEEPDKMDIDPIQFKEELENAGNITDVNLFINSPGGSVFASSTIVSILQRYKQENNVKIHSFIDGLCASAATYLCMVADDINIYQNSIMMVHKPMSFAWGNANDLQKEIDTLNTIENNMMVPMYMKKAKCDEEKMKELVNNETWFNSNEKDELYIGNFFDVNVLEEAKEVAACVSPKMFENYKHVPNNLQLNSKGKKTIYEIVIKNEVKEENKPTQVENNYTYFEEKLKNIKK